MSTLVALFLLANGDLAVGDSRRDDFQYCHADARLVRDQER